MQKGLIFGIDPGVTTAIVIIDVDGNLIDLQSMKGMKLTDLINYASKYKKPLIVASDVKPMPKFVEKFCASIGSKSFEPEKSISIKEKKELTKGYSGFKNKHEYDALSAALKALKNYKNLFLKIENALKKEGLEREFDSIATKILKGESEGIKEAIEDFLKEQKKREEERRTFLEYEKMIQSLNQKIEKLETEREEFLEKIKVLERRLKGSFAEISQLKLKRRKFLANKISLLKEKIEKYQRIISLHKKIEEIQEKNLIPIIRLEKIDIENLNDLEESIGLKNKVVYVNSAQGLEILEKFGIKAIVSSKPMEKEKAARIEVPILNVDESELEFFETIGFMKKDIFEKKLAEARKESFKEWLSIYKRRI